MSSLSTPAMILAMFGCGGLILWLLVRSALRIPHHLPPGITGAVVWASEKVFACDGDLPMSGKPDQIIKLKNGLLVVIEVKSHAAVYLSDKIQISCYILILRALGHRVADYGFIRHEREDAIPSFTKVELLPLQMIANFHARAEAILFGGAIPKKASNPKTCNTCGQRHRCA